MPTIHDSIEEHAKTIFSQGEPANFRFYDASLNENGEMLKPIHGPLHASRVALYTIVLINLYKKFATSQGDENNQFFQPTDSTNYITERDLKLLQIAALLHDSKRPKDSGSKPKYDAISADCCKKYLINLGVSVEEATQFANIIGNKEPPYGELSGKYRFFAKILHDADALDIIRIYANNFDIKLLEFFKDYCSAITTDIRDQQEDKLVKVTTNKPLKALSGIVMSVRDFIAESGDFYKQYDFSTKLSFELEPNCYELVKQRFFEQENLIHNSMFKAFFNEGSILTDSQASSIVTKIKTDYIEALLSSIHSISETDPRLISSLPELMKMGRIFMRSIVPKKTDMQSIASSIEIELKSIAGDSRYSNLSKSASLAGYGSKPFKVQEAGVGLLIVNNSFKNIRNISAKNLYSGTGDKSSWAQENQLLSPREAKLQSKRLKGRVMAGESTGQHNEIVIDIVPEDKIFIMLNSYEQKKILEALIMKQKYTQILQREAVIIFYSQNSNKLPQLNSEQLLIQYIQKELESIYLNFSRQDYRDFLIISLFESLEKLKLLPQQSEQGFYDIVSKAISDPSIVNYIIQLSKPTEEQLIGLLKTAIENRESLIVQKLLEIPTVQMQLLDNTETMLSIIQNLNALISSTTSNDDPNLYNITINLLSLLVNEPRFMDQTKMLFQNLISNIDNEFSRLIEVLLEKQPHMLSFFVEHLSEQEQLKDKLIYMANIHTDYIEEKLIEFFSKPISPIHAPSPGSDRKNGNTQ